MSVKSDAAELIRKGVEHIGKVGLAKGMYEEPTGEVCGLGAIKHVYYTEVMGVETVWAYPYPLQVPHVLEACEALNDSVPSKSFPTFNDDPNTTAEEVQKQMLKVADELEFDNDN